MLKELNRNFTRFGRLGTKPIKVVGLVRRAFARVPERTVYQVSKDLTYLLFQY